MLRKSSKLVVDKCNIPSMIRKIDYLAASRSTSKDLLMTSKCSERIEKILIKHQRREGRTPLCKRMTRRMQNHRIYQNRNEEPMQSSKPLFRGRRLHNNFGSRLSRFSGFLGPPFHQGPRFRYFFRLNLVFKGDVDVHVKEIGTRGDICGRKSVAFDRTHHYLSNDMLPGQRFQIKPPVGPRFLIPDLQPQWNSILRRVRDSNPLKLDTQV